MLWWWMLGWVAHAGCDDIAPMVEQAETAIFQVRFDAAEVLIASAEAAMSCGDLANPDLLARLWLAEGAMYAFVGDDVGSFHAYQAAIRVAPRLWVQDYGARLRDRYDEAFNTQVGRGLISFDPPLGFYEAAVDGRLVPEQPVEVAEGLHLVQIRPPGGQVVFGRVVCVDHDATARIRTGIVEVEPVAPPVEAVVEPVTEPVTRTPGKRWHWLIAGVSAGALAGGAALLAYNEKTSLSQATTADQVRGAHARQVGFAATAYALVAVSATGITLQFAL